MQRTSLFVFLIISFSLNPLDNPGGHAWSEFYNPNDFSKSSDPEPIPEPTHAPSTFDDLTDTKTDPFDLRREIEENRLLQENQSNNNNYDSEPAENIAHPQEFIQRPDAARIIFTQEISNLHKIAQEWQNSAPQRFDAYSKVVATHGQFIYAQHSIPSKVQDFFSRHNIKSVLYQKSQGNALQYELTEEIIAEFDRLARYNRPITDTYCNLLFFQSIQFLEEARECNEMGYCTASAQLIDSASLMIDCCYAAIQGTAQGILQGISSALAGAYHLIAHPVKSVKEAVNVTIKLAELMHDYIPADEPLWLTTTEKEREDYCRNIEHVEKNWRELSNNIKNWWRTTSIPELVRQITSGTANAVTTIIVGNKCLGFLNKMCVVAQTEMKLLYGRAQLRNRALAAATADGNLTPFFATMTEAELTAAAPTSTFFNKIDAASKAMEISQKLGFSKEAVSAALNILEQEGGCVKRFSLALEKLEKVPGLEKSIKMALNTDNIGHVRGGCFEIESALQMLERGEKIIAMGLEIPGPLFKREFDIVTETKLIECKNWNWNRYDQDLLNARLASLEEAMQTKKVIADLQNKQLVLHSKHTLPNTAEFNKFKNWLKNNMIELIEE